MSNQAKPQPYFLRLCPLVGGKAAGHRSGSGDPSRSAPWRRNFVPVRPSFYRAPAGVAARPRLSSQWPGF